MIRETSLFRIFAERVTNSHFERMIFFRFRRIFSTIILALTAGVALPWQSAFAQTITDTFYCGHTSHIDLGSVLTGATLQDSLFLVDDEGSSDSVVFITFPSGDFLLTNHNIFGLDSSRPVLATVIQFSRSTLGVESDSIVLESRGNTLCRSTYYLTAEAVGPDTNNSIIPLNHTSHDIIGFKKSDSSSETLHIRFENNFDSSITIDSLRLQNGTAFRIDSSSVSYPHTLLRDSSVTLALSFIANSPGFYTDFVIMPGRPILPFSVQGLLLPNLQVQSHSNTSTYVWIYPNPSQGPVTVHTQNLTRANVIISDVLGRTLAKASFIGDWQWMPKTNNTASTPSTYFVTVSGQNADGVQVHEVRRIVIQ